MNIYDIIEKKKNGISLNKEEIFYFVQGYTKGEIPDYQIAALLMAICIQGMDEQEIYHLTMAITQSGDTIDLSAIHGVTVDKHSTGGVGDKTTLIIVPIVACLGGKVAKMSGRGLGYTGGTIDKLEAIKGFQIQLEREKFIEQVNHIGACLVGQSGNLTPADKKIYALRDVTATVDSIPLIASSVMSKKIAAGSQAIVLDVKMGSGTFMKTEEKARELARTMVKIGKNAGRKMLAVITNMDIPLGYAIGNALEVKEAIEVLEGKGAADLTHLCVELATYMIMLCNGKEENVCREMVKECIKNGEALKKLKEIIQEQGGNIACIEDTSILENATYKIDVLALRSGYIAQMNTEEIGKISCKLGAGRETKEDDIDYAAGIVLKAKTGDYIQQGQSIAQFHTNNLKKAKEQEENFWRAITIQETPVSKQSIIYDVIK